MQTADADGGCGRRMADGGHQTADGGWRMADADGGQTNDKNEKIKINKYINKYKNKNNQLIIKKRKKGHVEISPGTRRLYFDNKNENY